MTKTYTITLADGRQLTDLGLNGTNYISKTRVDESIFQNNLQTMTITDGETTETLHNAVLVQQIEWSDGTWYLCFREKTAQELAEEALKKAIADIDYLAIMSGISMEV